MPRLIRRIVSRGYEMDARQRVTPGALARYLEHVRWQAITDAGAGLSTLFEGGSKIVIRAQDLHVGAALLPDVEVDLQISVAQVGNTSLKFAQRALRVSDGALLASSLVTAVALGANNRPTRVAEALKLTVEPTDLPPAPNLFSRASDDVWSARVGVRPSDLDALSHVNQSKYIDYVDDVRELAASAQAYGAQSGRARHYPTRIAVDYMRETRVGHDLRVYTWPADAAGAFAFELTDAVDGATVARATLYTSA